jgi:inositol 2-dehydrogenase
MIHLGVYGCGNRTKALLASLRLDKFYSVAALYDIRREAALSLQQEYGGVICHTPEELISTPGIDAFIISLSPFAHADALRKTFKAEKPIFIEKPVSFSPKEIKELAETAAKLQIPVQVGFMRRYCAWHRAALEYMKSNPPGHIFSINCNWFHTGETEMLQCLKNCPGNFRLQVSQIPFHCCHALDVMLLYGGPVKQVTAQALKLQKRPYPSPDDLIAILEFTGGAIGEFHYSSMSYLPFELSYRIHTENYSMKINFDLKIANRPRFHTSRADFENNCSDHYFLFSQAETRSYLNAEKSTTENIMFDFIEMVKNRKMPAADLETAYTVAELAESIELSAKTGRTIELARI